MTALTRAELIRGSFVPAAPTVRPPWALTEAAFRERCDGCGDCVAACPEEIIRMGRGRLPELDFGRGGCSFCGDCVRACPTDALTSLAGAAAWHLKAAVSDACFNAIGVLCRACEEHCEAGALSFRPRVRGRGRIVVDEAASAAAVPAWRPVRWAPST